jgi:hypothetical protein
MSDISDVTTHVNGERATFQAQAVGTLAKPKENTGSDRC